MLSRNIPYQSVKRPAKFLFLVIIFFALINGLNAQIMFPAGDFWSLDGGFGMSSILVNGTSYQVVIDPKLWLSPPLLVGSKLGINFSVEGSGQNILTFEGQVYLRWNFLRLGKNPEKTFNFFLQGGLGILAAYRGDNSNPFGDVRMTRGSVLADAALGVTIPLTSRWHLEPQVRGGYPHIVGFSLTAGYKFPLPEKTKYEIKTEYQTLPGKTEYVEVIKTLPPQEIVKRIMISSIEFILFGPDTGKYNAIIDHDAQALNELVLNSIAQKLKDNPEYQVRIEGNANPVTTDPREADELMTLSSLRAHAVADQLRLKGVRDEQMSVIAYGGTRTVVAQSDHDEWNRNRRVELILIQVDAN